MLKYIPEPSSFDIHNIAEDVRCCERTVYRALRELRTDREEESKQAKMINTLKSMIKVLYNFMETKMQVLEEPSVKEMETIKKIEDMGVVNSS